MKISKIEAAVRQLDTAIRLFLANDDWIAIHTLAAASGRVLRDLTKQSGCIRWQWLDEPIRPEKRKEAWRHYNKAANFFKHADKDHDHFLEDVDPAINDHFILIACLLFMELEKRSTDPIKVFLCWYVGAYPDTLNDKGIPDWVEFKRLSVWVQEDLPRAEQLAFWRGILELRTRSQQ